MPPPEPENPGYEPWSQPDLVRTKLRYLLPLLLRLFLTTQLKLILTLQLVRTKTPPPISRPEPQG